MKIVAISVISFTVLLDLMGSLSSMPPKTMDLLGNFGKSNEHDNDQGDRNAGESFPDRHYPPASPRADARHHSHNRSSPPAVTLLRDRSRSPSFAKIFGYGVDQLEWLRLIPYKNPQRQFELRRYFFSAEKSVLLLIGHNQYVPVPSKEQIVLSTPDGDVIAILDSSNILCGIYAYNYRNRSKGRAKINMISGSVTALTSDEIKEAPVGARRHFSHSYRVEHLNHSHGSSSIHRPLASPTRLPSSDGSGYELDQMQFIRLITNRLPHQIFELRKYTFPANKLILLLEGGNDYRPIPMQESIVLTTHDGDVFAALESMNDLAGIYTYIAQIFNRGRVKINIRTGAVTPLTRDEIWAVPVGKNRPILQNFRIQYVNHTS